MKRLSSLLSSLISLMALGALVAAAALFFATQQSEPASTTGAAQSPIPTPVLPPAPFTSPLVEPGPTWAAPTPLPDRGVRTGDFTKVPLLTSTADVSIARLYGTDLDGDMLVGSAVVQGGITVVAVDLTTGRVQRLSRVAERDIGEPRVSGRHIAWVEWMLESDKYVGELHVFDLEQAREFTIVQGTRFHQLDLKDDILAWQDNLGRGLGIYGHDLASNREFTVIEGADIHSFPRICSREWVTYLQHDQGWPDSADLRAHNLTTGEDILIGQMPFPRNASAGRQHGCDGSRVAWVGMQIRQSVPIYKQHVYDLSTRSDRVLNIPVRAMPSVLLSGDVLISSVGYDLARDVPFSVPSKIPPKQFLIGSTLLLSKDRTVWIVDEPDGSQGIYIAPITRR